jgi:CRP-like cAMP-binding protein
MARSQPRQVKIDGFDPQIFLNSIGAGGSILHFQPGQIIFRQGDPAPALFYLQQGRVQISIISDQGKEGVTAIHGAGELFGQEGMMRLGIHRSNAVSTAASTIRKIDNRAMIRVMQAEPSLAISFLSFVLWRNTQIEDDLIDQLFNSSEKRLARHLLKLAGLSEIDISDDGMTAHVIPRTSQEALASRIGTTRGRINYFMNKFRRLGHIDYDGEITVRASLADIMSDDIPFYERETPLADRTPAAPATGRRAAGTRAALDPV